MVNMVSPAGVRQGPQSRYNGAAGIRQSLLTGMLTRRKKPVRMMARVIARDFWSRVRHILSWYARV